MSELVVKNHIIDASIEEILKCVKKELTNGKLKVIQSKGDQVKVTCPHHSSGLEKNADCYVNASKNNELEYGYYHCFACGDSGRLTKFIGECFDADESFGED